MTDIQSECIALVIIVGMYFAYKAYVATLK